MIWKRRKLEKEKKEKLALAAEQPIPQPPVTTSEIKPGVKRSSANFFSRVSPAPFSSRGEQPSGLPKGIAWGIALVVVLFVAGFVISFFVAKHELARSVAAHSETLGAGMKDLQNFDLQGAEQQFQTLSDASSGPEGVMGALGALFHEGGAFASFTDLSRELTVLPQECEALQEDLFNMDNASSIANSSTVPSSAQADSFQASGSFSTDLNALQGTVDALDNDTDQMSSGISSLGGSSILNSQDYIALKAQLHSTREFLDEFAPWVATSTPHHVLVLLLNSSELRPGGGFLGSYADITIASGTIANVAVHDVADVDAGFTANIVPPKALQPEISRFRPADANWFFDFPTSASETLSLFGQSSLYSGTATSTPSRTALTPSNTSTSFDGVIAVSPDVIRDLLAVTGPITISVSSTPSGVAASTTFDSSNFLVQIQKLVQNGQAQSATYPKAVLRGLTSAMFGDLAVSTSTDKQGLFETALTWIDDKDVLAYFKDPEFENFLKTFGAAGDVYQVPQNFNGDYLAVADANVNGGKSDLYVSSTITWQSQINSDGTIEDSVVIDRAHNGNTSPYWWYQVTNQDYLQLFVPDGSVLSNESGGLTKTIVPPVNYAKLGYSTDPMIVAIESSTEPIFGYPAVTTHEEDGKEVFATWSKVASGAKAELSFEYSHQAFSTPTDGTQYQFIFEKQASTVRHYSFEFDAPLGYQFVENGLPTYMYQSDDLPGRLIITLTLEKA